MEDYEPLTAFLKRQLSNEIRLTFDDLEDTDVVGIVLPPSARLDRRWWENQESTNGRQCHAWLDAGWAVRDVRLGEECVIFQRSTITLKLGLVRRRVG